MNVLNKVVPLKENNVSENNWKEIYKAQQYSSSAKQKTVKAEKSFKTHTTSAIGAGTVRRVIFAVLASICLVQIIIWAMICISLGHFVSPWWLWSAIPASLIIGIIQIIPHKQ